MKARDYLVNKGLAKAKARGRFSLEALAALRQAVDNGQHFSDYNVAAATKAKTKIVAPVLVKEAIRKETVFYGIDKGTRPEHSQLTIAFETCYGCMRPVSYCKHEIPQLPAWIGGGNGMWNKPC
jgi:hypothetical protein